MSRVKSTIFFSKRHSKRIVHGQARFRYYGASQCSRGPPGLSAALFVGDWGVQRSGKTLNNTSKDISDVLTILYLFVSYRYKSLVHGN